MFNREVFMPPPRCRSCSIEWRLCLHHAIGHVEQSGVYAFTTLSIMLNRVVFMPPPRCRSCLNRVEFMPPPRCRSCSTEKCLCLHHAVDHVQESGVYASTTLSIMFNRVIPRFSNSSYLPQQNEVFYLKECHDN
ncbi:hypothetical protein CHS0354_025198 [Potamilus streckersoni]|uniref:Uncharacterized protein n=1 Tax=Potamilus streckersoni TaxID=2493646 RepID=A0AAE0VG42_9BIVA|nr:hypothetical protein CHS0354_025198 [Potamilus streckersoni]